jgi:hypothetical protein
MVRLEVMFHPGFDKASHPWLVTRYTPDSERLHACARRTGNASHRSFSHCGHWELHFRIEKTYSLEEAAQAHWDLATRVTTGKLLLIPERGRSQTPPAERVA